MEKRKQIDFETDKDLCEIMFRNPELAEEAWQIFLERINANPELSKCLRFVIRFVPVLRKRAGEILTESATVVHDLFYVIEQTRETDDLRLTAGEKILRKGAANNVLLKLMLEVPELSPRVWRQLLAQGISNSDLCHIIKWCPDLADAAWGILMPRINNEDLMDIVRKTIGIAAQDSCEAKAAEILLGRRPKNSELFEVMRRLPCLAERAWQQVRANGVVEKELQAARREFPFVTNEKA